MAHYHTHRDRLSRNTPESHVKVKNQRPFSPRREAPAEPHGLAVSPERSGIAVVHHAECRFPDSVTFPREISTGSETYHTRPGSSFLWVRPFRQGLMRPPDTRHSLIVRLKDQRNEPAWTEFVCAYEPFLTRLVRRQGTPDRHAADVTQQILIAIAKSVDGWKPDGQIASFRRWLGRVARNVVIKFMMRERKQITGQGGSDFLKLIEQTTDASIDAEQARKYEQELILWAAELVRGEFRDTSWRAFWATQVEGRSVAEVSQALGVTPGSIYMSRSRIFARIRTHIAEVMEDD